MVLPDVRLLAVAGPPTVEVPALLDACQAAVAGGATAVQIRVKDLPAAGLVQAAESLVAALPIPVYVNDRADVAWAAGAHGVHVGTDDVSPAAVRTFAGDALRIGVSVGTPAEAEAALAADVDYWSVGSVYATATKPDTGAPIGTAGFRSLAARAPGGMSIIAIGGITAANAAEVIQAGACGVAVSSAIFSAPNIAQATRALREVVDRALSA